MIPIPFEEWLTLQPGRSATDGQLFLTEEEVRAFPQFRDATPEEVSNIINTLHDVAIIMYNNFCKDSKYHAPERGHDTADFT